MQIESCGRENGPKYSYLAVLLNNEPALKLYSKIGCSEIYKYWYRIKFKRDDHACNMA